MESVVIVAPNSFGRLTGAVAGMATSFQLVTRSHHFATLPNLTRLAHAAEGAPPKMASGRETVNPMAGYYLESFLKLRGYDARTVFEWTPDTGLAGALDPEPLAVLFSTTFVPHRALLEECLAALRAEIDDLPLVVGGPLIWKHKIEMERCAGTVGDAAAASRKRNRLLGESLVQGLKRFGVDPLAENLFGPEPSGAMKDVIFVGSEFGEHTLLRVLEEIAGGASGPGGLGHVPNLLLPVRGGWHVTKSEPEPIDLERDFTRWDLIDSPPTIIPMRTSVGCPYRCTFCDFIELHAGVKMRSPESILEEIRTLKKCGRGFVNFVDDNIFLSKKRVDHLSRTLIEGEANVLWGGLFRVDRVDEDNIEQLKQSGCTFGLCGIESGDPGVLKLMQKGCEQEEIYRGIEMCSQAGIHTSLTFICGFPSETPETIENTIGFINRLTSTGKATPCYQVYPYYLLSATAADDPGLRERHDLKGRGVDWVHATMSYQDVVERWAPHIFTSVDSIPYEYFGLDATPFLSSERRTRAYRARKALTCAFLREEEDAVIQGHLEELFRILLHDRAIEVPPWRSVLAERGLQPRPGCREDSPFASS